MYIKLYPANGRYLAFGTPYSDLYWFDFDSTYFFFRLGFSSKKMEFSWTFMCCSIWRYWPYDTKNLDYFFQWVAKVVDTAIGMRWLHMGVSKNSGFSPQIIHFNRVFHYFHHPFWGFSPYFWKTPVFLAWNVRVPSISALPRFSGAVLERCRWESSDLLWERSDWEAKMVPSLGIQSPKLRMGAWNQNTMRFEGDWTPQSSAEDMTIDA